MDMRTMRTSRISLLSLLILTGVGCGDATVGQVEGTVTLDDAPVVAARVRFTAETGIAPYGETDENGHYVLNEPGAVVGNNRVTISTRRFRRDRKGFEANTPETVPAKYNTETELIKEVVPGNQTIDFDLKSD